jgi:DedD protein
MSERLQDADRAVDEQKRRARRRLVGAVVLAASAAVIVPMLLEKEPQPLGEDVSVQIPPVDEGKFVNRLTRGKGDATPKADAKAGALPKPEPAKPDAANADAAKPAAAKTDAAKAEPSAAASSAANPPAETNASAPPSAAAPAASAAAPANSIGQAEQRMLSPSPPKSPPPADTKSSAPAAAAAPSAPSPAATSAAPAYDAKAAASGSFAVQLAAFSDDKGANALANKLRKAGYASAHVEAVDAKGSKLWRVRVGGFATRAEAETARVKLKNEGFNGIVTPVR